MWVAEAESNEKIRWLLYVPKCKVNWTNRVL
jgi:hypothetical protein